MKTHLSSHFLLSFSALLVGDTSETNRNQKNAFISASKKIYLNTGNKKKHSIFLINEVTSLFFYNGDTKFCSKYLCYISIKNIFAVFALLHLRPAFTAVNVRPAIDRVISWKYELK